MGSPQENFPDNDYSSTPNVLLKEELIAPSTLSSAFECVSYVCSAFNYEYFLIATVPDFNDPFETENILLTNLPAYITGDLVRMEQSGEWCVLQGLENTLAPFCWHKDQGGEQGENTITKTGAASADQLFIEHLDVTTIHCVQTPTRNHRRVFIAAFCGTTKRTIPSEFVLAFLEIFDRIEHLLDDHTSKVGTNLTARELECLRWASVGKTSAEIAVITSLSEHTVNHYLNSSCKKLDCLNRTQAVAKVLRSGVIT